MLKTKSGFLNKFVISKLYLSTTKWDTMQIFGIFPYNINCSILGYKGFQNDRCNSEDTGLSK